MTQPPTTSGIRRVLRALRLGAGVALVALACGCTSLLVDDKPRDPSTIYSPDPRVPADPGWPSVPWQLVIASPTAARLSDSVRIAVRPSPNEIQIYKGARWARSPSHMLEDALLHSFEDSGRVAAVARQVNGIDAEYKLLLDVRRFESDYGQAAVPAATIEVAAKLMHMHTQQVVASRTFLEATPAASTAVPDVVSAFEQSLAAITRGVVGWTLTSGAGHSGGTSR
jgi:cholesterol transport system auxiliary component